MKQKLCSRKLWMSIASFASMFAIYFGAAESEATQIASLIMAGATVIGYVIGEGLADSSTNLEPCVSELDSTNDSVDSVDNEDKE